MNDKTSTRSLKRQAISIALTAQIVCALLLSGAALLHEWHTRYRTFDVRIQGHSDSLVGAIQDAEDADDNVTIDSTELKLPADDVYAVYNKGGRLLGKSSFAPSALINRGQDGFRDVRADGHSYRVFQTEALRVIDRAEFGADGLRRPVTILYASPEGHVRHEISEAVRFYLISIVLAAALSAFLIATLLRRSLQPLTELAVEAAHIAAPTFRFDPPASVVKVRELRPLADVLTETVARLRESFAKEHRFVGDAAHELKTAIAVVRSSIQILMLKQRSVAEYKSGLERVLEDNRRVEALVAQMLQLAQLEESSNAAIPVIDLTTIAVDGVARLQSVAEARGVSIRTQAPSTSPVRVFPEAAAVLVSNLLLNAVQHSEPNSEVRLSTRREGSGQVVLEVADHGMGIGADALPHIFERFYREDVSRSRETGGTGLGLAICKSIVDASHGTIEVRSIPGQGTVITVTFRRA